MPVNSSRQPRLSVSSTTHHSFGPVSSATSFLFDTEDDDKHLSLNAIDLKSPVAKAFAQLEGDDTFPTLTSDGLKVLLTSWLLPSLRACTDEFIAICQFCSS